MSPKKKGVHKLLTRRMRTPELFQNWAAIGINILYISTEMLVSQYPVNLAMATIRTQKLMTARARFL